MTADAGSQAAERARTASHGLALATRAQKDRALHAMADALLAAADASWPPTPRTSSAPRPAARPPTSSTGSG